MSRKKRYIVSYIGTSKSMKDFEFNPMEISAYTFMEAACLAVAQVEYQEPGNFEVVSVVLA